MPYAAPCVGRCSALRCPVQRPAFPEALVWAKCLGRLGKSLWARRSLASASLEKSLKRSPPSLPILFGGVVQPFWWSSPSILSSRFFLLGKAAQASSSSVSSFRIKQSRHPLLSFLPFEKSCQTPPRPPLSPLKKAAGRSFFLFLSPKATMCIRLHAPRRRA